MASSLTSRLSALEARLNKTEYAPVLIFADDSLQCDVGDTTVYRLEGEDADDYFDRCSVIYDQQFGNRPTLSVRVRCSSRFIPAICAVYGN